jgi:ElaB/YqjD/DUF883 family membrane-anchored ribosome-binding protein
MAITVSTRPVMPQWKFVEEGDMATDAVAVAKETLKTEIANGVDKLKDFSCTLKENLETASEEIRRGVKRGKVAVENAVKDTRYEIRNRPLASVAISAAGGLVIGLALGWLFGYRRRK